MWNVCWSKGRLYWKIAKLFHFCHLSKLVRPETYGPYHVSPSKQRSLLRFFTQNFKFYCLLLGKKKAHVIDFSFKFNEIKFCTLFMNWLIWKKCSPIFIINLFLANPMHYIKCAVNSSLLTFLWLLQKVCGTMDPCFITTHSIHKEGNLQIYFGVIFHKNNPPQTGPHHIWYIYTPCLSLAARSTQQRIWVEDFARQCLL